MPELRSRGATELSDTDPALELEHPTEKLCEGKQYTIGYMTYDDTTPSAVDYHDALQRGADMMGCVKIVSLVSKADPTTAVRNAKTLAQRQVDGVVVREAISGIQPAIKRTFENAGIPVVGVVLPLPDSPVMGSDPLYEGSLGGKAAAQAIKEAFPDEQPYALIQDIGSAGDLAAQRTKGFEEGVKQVYPSLPGNRISRVATEASATSSHDRTAEASGRVPKGAKIVVGALGDDQALAMVSAMQQVGRAQDSYVVGIGGTPEVARAICANKGFYGVVWHNHDLQSISAIAAVVDLINGKKVPAFVTVPSKVLTRENVSEVYPNSGC